MILLSCDFFICVIFDRFFIFFLMNKFVILGVFFMIILGYYSRVTYHT